MAIAVWRGRAVLGLVSSGVEFVRDHVPQRTIFVKHFFWNQKKMEARSAVGELPRIKCG
jgi:hypothetical protein